MKLLLIFLSISITTSSLIKSADSAQRKLTALEQCQIRNAAEKSQLEVLSKFLKSGFSFEGLTLYQEPLLTRTNLSLETVTLLLQGGCDPLAKSSTGKSCFQVWLEAVDATQKREKRKKKIAVVALMANRILEQGQFEQIVPLIDSIENDYLLLSKLPQSPTSPTNILPILKNEV